MTPVSMKKCIIVLKTLSINAVNVDVTLQMSNKEAPLGVFGIRDIRAKYYLDTGYLRKKLLGYRILRSSFRDTGYSQKIVTYQMFDEKRSWITKYMPFSVFLLMIRYK